MDDELASFFSDTGDDAADEVDDTDDASLLLADDAPDADDEAVNAEDAPEDLEASDDLATAEADAATFQQLRDELAARDQAIAERDRLDAERARQQDQARQTLRHALLSQQIQQAMADLPDLEPEAQRQRVMQIARAVAEPAHEEAQRQREHAESAAKVAAALHLSMSNLLGGETANAVMSTARELLRMPDLGRMEGHLAARRGQTLEQENAALRRQLQEAALRNTAKQRQASGKDRVARGAPAKPAKPRAHDIDAAWEEFASSPEMRAVFGD